MTLETAGKYSFIKELSRSETETLSSWDVAKMKDSSSHQVAHGHGAW